MQDDSAKDDLANEPITCCRCSIIPDEFLSMNCRHHICLNCAKEELEILNRINQSNGLTNYDLSLKCYVCQHLTLLHEKTVGYIESHVDSGPDEGYGPNEPGHISEVDQRAEDEVTLTSNQIIEEENSMAAKRGHNSNFNSQKDIGSIHSEMEPKDRPELRTESQAVEENISKDGEASGFGVEKLKKVGRNKRPSRVTSNAGSNAGSGKNYNASNRNKWGENYRDQDGMSDKVEGSRENSGRKIFGSSAKDANSRKSDVPTPKSKKNSFPFKKDGFMGSTADRGLKVETKKRPSAAKDEGFFRKTAGFQASGSGKKVSTPKKTVTPKKTPVATRDSDSKKIDTMTDIQSMNNNYKETVGTTSPVHAFTEKS